MSTLSLRARWAKARAEGNRAGHATCSRDRSPPQSAGPGAARQGRDFHDRGIRRVVQRKAASNEPSGRTLGCRGRLRCRPSAHTCNLSPRRGPTGPVAGTIRVSFPLIPFRSQWVFPGVVPAGLSWKSHRVAEVVESRKSLELAYPAGRIRPTPSPAARWYRPIPLGETAMPLSNQRSARMQGVCRDTRMAVR